MKLAILTPAYNATKYLDDLHGSISSIKSKIKIEWIIINDGSTDDIKAKIKSYNKPWIKLVNKKNGGLGTARTRGVIEARKSGANYIWHMDSDDYIDSSKFFKIEKLLDNITELIKVGDYLLDDKTGLVTNDKLYSLKNFTKKWQVWPQGLIVKLDIIPKDFYFMPKNGDISYLEIFDVINRENIKVIEDYISIYRVNMASSMSTNRNWKADYRSCEYALDVSSRLKNKDIRRIAIKGARNDLCFGIFLAKKSNQKIDTKKFMNHFNLLDKLIIRLTKITPRFIPKLVLK